MSVDDQCQLKAMTSKALASLGWKRDMSDKASIKQMSQAFILFIFSLLHHIFTTIIKSFISTVSLSDESYSIYYELICMGHNCELSESHSFNL